MPDLTPKQARFVDEYLIDLNATQAAIRSGYAESGARTEGARLLANADITAALVEARKKWEDRTAITQNRVLAELGKLGFASIADYVDVSGDTPTISLKDVPRDKLAALSEITTETVMENRGNGKVAEIRRVKIKLWDKRAALVDIGRHLGMFKEKLEVSGPNGGPIETKEVSARELIAGKLTRLAARSDPNGDPGKPE